MSRSGSRSASAAGLTVRCRHGVALCAEGYLSVPHTLYRRPCSSSCGKSGSATGVPQSVHDWAMARLMRTPTLVMNRRNHISTSDIP